jgi:2-oxoglutarate dehydrogenase E2 component (dihydrolipoamide succinyltransferase)
MAKVEIVFPQMGESIVEGTISKWIKKPGDEIKKDETVLEISTDKVDSEVPAAAAGILEKVLVPEGSRAEVGQVIGVIETDASKAEVAEMPDAPIVAEKKTTPAGGAEKGARKKPTRTRELGAGGGAPRMPGPGAYAGPIGKGDPNQMKRFFSPLVRSMASQEGVSEAELFFIEGSGDQGRVTKDDLLYYLENRDKLGIGGGSAPLPKALQGAISGAVSEASEKLASEGLAEIESMDSMRKVIAERMWESTHISPHVTSFHEVDLTDFVNFRDQNKVAFKEKHGFNLTYTMLLTYEAIKTLEEFPYINASLEGDKIVKKKDINMGIAVSVDPLGLMVPVIQKAQEKSPVDVFKSFIDLALRARDKKLTPDELAGSTFSITNLGTFGSLTGTPIINQPNVAILGLGTIQKQPGVVTTEKGDSIEIRRKMILSLAYDHRLVDGALGGRFLKALADRLENYNGVEI